MQEEIIFDADRDNGGKGVSPVVFIRILHAIRRNEETYKKLGRNYRLRRRASLGGDGSVGKKANARTRWPGGCRGPRIHQ